MDLTAFRKEYPQYKDIPDAALIEVMRTKYYPDVPREAFKQAFETKFGAKDDRPRSYGVGGTYEPLTFKQKRQALAKRFLEGIVPPPGTKTDPETGEWVPREDYSVKAIDPVRGVGDLIEAIGGIIPAAAVYPEGVPDLAKEIVEGTAHAYKNVIQASPVTSTGAPNPLYNPEASIELIRDPVGHAAVTAAPLLGVKGFLKRLSKSRRAPKIKTLEQIKASKRVPDVPDVAKEQPKIPAVVLDNPRLISRIETGRKMAVDAFGGDYSIEVRKSGEQNFRYIAPEDARRLRGLIENNQAPIRNVVLHKGGKLPTSPKQGDVTLRVGSGIKQRLYRIRRIEPEGEVKVSNSQPKPAEAAQKGQEVLFFAPPEVIKAGEFVRGVSRTTNQFLDHVVRATESTLRSEPSKKLRMEMRKAQEYGGVLQSEYTERALSAGLHRLREVDGIHLSDVLEGKAQARTLKINETAQQISKIFEESYWKIREVGLKVTEQKPYKTKAGKLRFKKIVRDPRQVKGYVPRMVKTEIAHEVFMDLKKAVKQLEDLAKSGADDQRLAAIIGEWVRGRNPLLRGKTYDALEMMIAKGMNPLEALRILQRRSADEIFRPASFEHARTVELPDYFYERDMRVIFPRYISTLSRRYGQSKVWDPEGKTLYKRLQQISEINPEEGNLARDIVDLFTGEADIKRRAPEWRRKLVDVFVEYEIYSKIYAGTAAIPNAIQFSISTIPKGGVYRFLKGLHKIATEPEFRAQVKRTSAMHTATRANLIFAGFEPRYTALRAKLDRYLTKHPFNCFNRMQSYLAAATGEVYVTDLHRLANNPKALRAKWASRKLSEFGIDHTKPLTVDAIDRAMYRFATDTQLLRDILKEQIWANDPRFRFGALFFRFGYKQFRFFKSEVFNEVRRGNVLPLVRAAALGYLGGELVQFAKDRLREGVEGVASLAKYGKYEFIPRYRRDPIKDPKSFMIHALNNYAVIGTLGFFSDIFRVPDPKRYDLPSDLAGEIYDNVKFIVTPVFIREIISGGENINYFMRNWKDKGLRAAVDQLELDVLRDVGPMARYAAGGLTEIERDLSWEARKAIESNNDSALMAIVEIATHRGLDPSRIINNAVRSYKSAETQKLTREYRIFEYKAKKAQ